MGAKRVRCALCTWTRCACFSGAVHATHLCSDGVGPGGKQLGDARSLEALLREAHGRAQPCAARADDDGVVRVVDCTRGGERGVRACGTGAVDGAKAAAHTRTWAGARVHSPMGYDLLDTSVLTVVLGVAPATMRLAGVTWNARVARRPVCARREGGSVRGVFVVTYPTWLPLPKQRK